MTRHVQKTEELPDIVHILHLPPVLSNEQNDLLQNFVRRFFGRLVIITDNFDQLPGEVRCRVALQINCEKVQNGLAAFWRKLLPFSVTEEQLRSLLRYERCPYQV
jgi:hypothetical protein